MELPRVPVAACFPRDGASRTASRSVIVRVERLFLPVAARLLHVHLNRRVELLCCEYGKKSHGTFDSSIFLTKTSLNPAIPRPIIYPWVSQNRMEGKGKEKKNRKEREDEQKKEKKSITMSFPAFNVGPETSNSSRSNFHLSHSREVKNETRATILRRTYSWRSFHYLLGPVIERKTYSRPDMI
ncbi:hypothetical protein CEXT_499751 [Caerostris extrusa]|uniref:Uncharacterized protein n=1 Tax=Caerostris extrusa TaxID=172846 RepID=A0AAV4MV26_CAEEX|nr:hypothetical protein CEXT_499751 [Caerostris extrusa]